MNNKYLSRLFFFIMFLYPIVCFAKTQERVVIDTIVFKEVTDITARMDPEYDKDNNPCALIKVYAPLMENLRFRGDAIVKETKVDNGIWLWVKDRCADITIEAKNMMPITITMADYGYPRLHAKTTYQLNITVGHERETVIYKDIDVHNVVYKTKYVDSYKYDKDKVYCFLMYQCKPGSTLGVNIGICIDSGFYLSYNHSDNGFFNYNGFYDVSTFMGGTMFRLTPFLYLQTGLGLTYGEQQLHFTCGANMLFRIKRFVVGCGYNYDHMSVSENRNVLLDGITAQVGLNF